jgi:hypothetical protein
MSDLIARLEAMAPVAAAGDWLDVSERAERLRSRTLRRRLIVAVAVAVLAVPTIAIATGHWDVVSLTATEEEVPLPQGENTLGYVIGDRMKLPGRQPVKLAAPLLAPFIYPSTPLVVPSADRTKVVYHSWQGDLGSRTRGPRGVPVLRLFDSASGRDVVLARGAHSPAWRADGVLAYARARLSHEPRGVIQIGKGHLVVRRTLDGPAVRWSTIPSRWTDVVWAGRHLLARARFETPSKWGGLIASYQFHAFSGPGRSRRLPLGALIAVSPDGRYAFGHAKPDGQGTDHLMRLIEVATGRVVAEIRQTSGPGAWAGDTIILTTGFVSEPLGPGPGGIRVLPRPSHVQVIVLRFSGGRLTVERELRLSREVIEATGLQAENFQFYYGSPTFVDKAARQFTARVAIHNTDRERKITNMVVYLTCDWIEVRCRRGRSLDPHRFRWSTLVYNPSRPLPD